MSDRRWFRSLYWRIGLGSMVLLAVMLAAQAASFVWIAVQTEGGQPESMGQDFAELVATDLESALAKNPALDLRQYASTRLVEFHRPAFIVFPGGAVVGPPGEDVPPGLDRFADAMSRGPRGPFGGPGRPGRPGGFGGRGGAGGAGSPEGAGGSERSGGAGAPRADGPPEGADPLREPEARDPGRVGRRAGGRGPQARLDGAQPGLPQLGPPPMFGRRRLALAPVRFQGQTVAMVFVAPAVGVRRITEELGPWLALGSILLLVGGTAVAALLVFRPAQARLRALEEAARRFGEGDLRARAPAIGGDEVAAVAHAFNQMADDLGARQAQLTEADRARRQLLADVSHELMTPLTAIRGYAETLTLPQFGPSAADGQRYVRIIQEEVDRIDRLVVDLLDLARYEASGMTVVTEEVPVAELFDRVVARHEHAARDKNVAMRVRLLDEEMVIVADPRRMEQALQNLASNALRHTRPGGTVTISAEQRDGRTWLRVADTGSGIPAEHLPHVFDRFYKADPSRADTGSGLGLSIVKAIVERHGGAVRARSVPGLETVFEIDLPARGAVPDAAVV